MDTIQHKVKVIVTLLCLILSITALKPGESISEQSLEKKLSRTILQRNDIFARHGYVFKSSELNRHYKRQAWYHADKKFTWNHLTAQDRKIFDGLQKREKNLLAALKAKVQKRVTGKHIRYFKTVSGIRPFSPKLTAEIKAFMKKKDIFEDYFVMPEFRSYNLRNEILKTELTKLKDQVKKSGKTLSYYFGIYNNKGKLKSIHHCWYSDMFGEGSKGSWYLDDHGRIILITRAVSQTTLGSEWHFQYVHNMLVWMTFEIKSYAGSDYRVTRKFFP